MILKGLQLRIKNNRMLHLNIGFASCFFKKNYDLLAIGGYDQFAAWESLIFAKLLNIPVLLFGESTLKDKRSKNFILGVLKRLFIKACDGFVCAGTATSEYFKYLDASPEKIFIAPFSADYNYFHEKFLELKSAKNEIKIKKGYPLITILYSGRFSFEKGILYLLEAFLKLQKEMKNVGLVLLGEGPEEKKYRAYCETNKLINIFFEEFVQQENLPEYYAAADIFVLPSLSEPWGIVINEAMSFGLPIIATDSVGAAYDLIQEGVNGFVVKAGDANVLYTALKTLCMDEILRMKMGQESLRIIKGYTPKKWAQGFMNAVKNILSRRECNTGT
jgi:glycosyltransferase involved in cell wall biosynthesis